MTRIAICGPDRAGKSMLAARLAEATGLPVVKARDAALVEKKLDLMWVSPRPGLANSIAMGDVLRGSPGRCILDRGPLCTAAIHWMEWGLAERCIKLSEEFGIRTIFLDLPLDVARSRREDSEAESRNLEDEFAKYRRLASIWPNTFIIDATLHPERVFYHALQILQA